MFIPFCARRLVSVASPACPHHGMVRTQTTDTTIAHTHLCIVCYCYYYHTLCIMGYYCRNTKWIEYIDRPPPQCHPTIGHALQVSSNMHIL